MFNKSGILILVFIISLFIPADANACESYTPNHGFCKPGLNEPKNYWHSSVTADTDKWDSMLFFLVATGAVKNDTCLKIGEDVPNYCIKYHSSTGDMEISGNSSSNIKVKLFNSGSGVMDFEVEGTFSVGTLSVGAVTCTNCLNADQIQDIYYQKSTDENVGIVRISDGTDDALDTGNEVCAHAGETCMDVYHFASGAYVTTEDCTTVDPNSGAKFYVECR